MRKRVAMPIFMIAAVLTSVFFVVTPAQAHGYISSPPSRQALCAQGAVANCGDIVYEPQSVEAPKGSLLCNGGGSRFAVLNDNSRNWPATSVGQNVTFNWVLTARHATSTWEYFVGSTRIAVFNDGGQQPGATKAHSVSLGGRTGRVTVLARWNVADTAMAFYACVDLQVGSGGGGTTPPPPPPPPPTTCSPAWLASSVYVAGNTVGHVGRRWTAQWWTQGEEPGTTGQWGVWRDAGAC